MNDEVPRMTAFHSEISRLGRYWVVGVVTNGSIYLLFLAMIWAGMYPVLASGLCYGLGVTLSYLLNRRWTFSSQRGHGQDLPRFVLAYGIGLLVTLVSMWGLIRIMMPELAQLVTAVVSALSIYASLRFLGFGQTVPPSASTPVAEKEAG